MKTTFTLAQLLLRFALGIGFILPVLDRFGVLGTMGEPNIGWGNWANFIEYTQSLMPYLSRPLTNVMGIIATAGELICGVLLIVGYKTRSAAMGSAVLTIGFALSMLVFAGYRAPFNYSVFTCSAASLLLYSVPFYKWSIDAYLTKK